MSSCWPALVRKNSFTSSPHTCTLALHNPSCGHLPQRTLCAPTQQPVCSRPALAKEKAPPLREKKKQRSWHSKPARSTCKTCGFQVGGAATCCGQRQLRLGSGAPFLDEAWPTVCEGSALAIASGLPVLCIYNVLDRLNHLKYTHPCLLHSGYLSDGARRKRNTCYKHGAWGRLEVAPFEELLALGPGSISSFLRNSCLSQPSALGCRPLVILLEPLASFTPWDPSCHSAPCPSFTAGK